METLFSMFMICRKKNLCQNNRKKKWLKLQRLTSGVCAERLYNELWEHVDTHILSDCEAIDYLRFRHMGQFFSEPSDYYDAPINKVLHFIRSLGLIKG
jgi:hypothetical protein